MSTATYELRLWLPDRPGVLGQVASRIGAVRGDVIGIEILERGGGFAIDELTITLPDDQDVDDVDLVDLLIGELRQVDGVAVEDLRPVGVERRDATVAALDVAVAVAAAPPGERLAICCTELLRLLATDWAVAHRERDDVPLASAGAVPDDHWLGAFLDGTRHLDNTADGAPSDVAWAWLDDTAVALACGRHGRPFHARERQQLSRIAGLLDALPR
jgi:hypothetical protein